MTAEQTNLPNVALGLCVIALGVALLLHQAGAVPLEQVLRYWPVALVVIGASMLWPALRGQTASNQGAPLAAIFWIVVLGMLFSYTFERRTTADVREDAVNVFAMMGRDERRVPAGFAGGRMTAVMGRADLDLRQAAVGPGQTVELDVFTLMGGGQIRVPAGWDVTIDTTTVAGGVKDQRPRRNAEENRKAGEAAADTSQLPASGPSPRLLVRGIVVFGGLNIRQ
jgi:hypothetical protein